LFVLFLEKEKKRKKRYKIEKVQVKNRKTLYEKLEWRKDKSTVLASDTKLEYEWGMSQLVKYKDIG